MKTLSTALLVSLVVSFFSLAVAEPFNDRSDWLPQALATSRTLPHQGTLVTTEHFKDKSKWVVTIAAPYQASVCPTDTVLATHTPSFNDKYSYQC